MSSIGQVAQMLQAPPLQVTREPKGMTIFVPASGYWRSMERVAQASFDMDPTLTPRLLLKRPSQQVTFSSCQLPAGSTSPTTAARCGMAWKLGCYLLPLNAWLIVSEPAFPRWNPPVPPCRQAGVDDKGPPLTALCNRNPVKFEIPCMRIAIVS